MMIQRRTYSSTNQANINLYLNYMQITNYLYTSQSVCVNQFQLGNFHKVIVLFVDRAIRLKGQEQDSKWSLS